MTTSSPSIIPKRLVSAAFVNDLLVNDKYKPITANHGLVLADLLIEGAIDLPNATFSESVSIVNSDVLGRVDFGSAVIKGDLSFPGSNLYGGLNLKEARIQGSLLVGEEPDPDPSPIKPRGGVFVYNIMAEGTRIEGDVNIVGSDVTDSIDFSFSHISGTLSIVRSKVPYITLKSGTFETQLNIVDDDVRVSQLSQSSGQNIFRWRTNPNVSLDMYLIRCYQSVFLDRSIFDRPIIASSAIIGSDLQMVGTHLYSLIAPGAHVVGALEMGFNNKATVPGYTRETPMTGWMTNSELDLRSASIGAIIAPELPEAWPKNLHLANIQVNSFTPGNCTSNQRFPVVANASCPHDPTWFRTWLGLDPDQENMTQPYQLIIDMLEKRGDPEEAAYVGMARGNKELKESFHFPFVRYVIFYAYYAMVGYGYHPEWSAYWIVGLTFLGTLIYRRTEHAKSHHHVLALAYSFDMLIPLVRLDEKHYQIELRGFPKYYFYVHRLAGWLLGSFLIAAIAGLNSMK